MRLKTLCAGASSLLCMASLAVAIGGSETADGFVGPRIPSADIVRLRPVGQYGGLSHAVAGSGDLLIAGTGPRLQVWRRAAPDRLDRVGEGPILDGLVTDIALTGRHALVADRYALSVFDVSLPAAPRRVARVLEDVGGLFKVYLPVAARNQDLATPAPTRPLPTPTSRPTGRPTSAASPSATVTTVPTDTPQPLATGTPTASPAPTATSDPFYAVTVISVQTTDDQGRQRMAFGPGEWVRLEATVTNPTGNPVAAELTWQVLGDENGQTVASLSGTRRLYLPAGLSRQALEAAITSGTAWGPYEVRFAVRAAGAEAKAGARLFVSAHPAWSDDFSDPASGWSTRNGADLRLAYLNGEYSLMGRAANSGYLSRSPRPPRADHVAVEFDVHRAAVTDDRHGLALGTDGNASTVSFVLDHTGQFTVYRQDPGGDVVDLVSWTKARLALGTAPNHLLLVRRGTDILVYANNQRLARVTEPALATAAWPALVVLTGNRPAEVRFDNYRQYDVAP